MPRLSIITINLNNATGLHKTIVSVINQSFPDFEYILIDGGSSDNSLQIIKQFNDKLNTWLSEPDRGIYDAMNKGIQLAKGDYCLFLNSGDWLAEPETLQQVFDSHPQADIVAGDVYFYDNKAKEIKWLVSSPDQLTAKTLFLGTLPHQATFIRRDLFDTIGPYNNQLRIASDWLFFVEALLVKHHTYQHYKGVVSFFNMDGISCNSETNSLPRQEQLAMLQQKYPRFLADYEQFDLLGTGTRQWVESREYRVYRYLERVGIIRFGVFCRRIKRGVLKVVFR